MADATNSQTATIVDNMPPPLPPSRVPLLVASSSSQSQHQQLELALRRLEHFLSIIGFNNSSSSILRMLLSFSVFLLLGIALPVVSILLSRCPSSPDQLVRCEVYRIESFDICVLLSQSSLAAISLVCISHNLHKHGIRNFLFVDRDHGQLDKFHDAYVQKIQAFFCSLCWWILPCLLVKISHEVVRFSYTHDVLLWKTVIVLLASIVSWIYLTTIFLCGCFLFNLVCNLQVIHFEDFAKILGTDKDLYTLLEDHIRLRYYLSKISHRFRVYLVLIFFFVSASEIVILIQTTTGYKGMVNFANAGDLTVSAVVEVVGLILCLNSATKISHRAQGIGSVASKWHASITCYPSDSSQLRLASSYGNLESVPVNSLVANYSESDLESLENFTVLTNTQLASQMSSYHKRQALVSYFHSNPGGITIFGWTVDRALISTIFFIELSLILFVLGKTIILSAK